MCSRNTDLQLGMQQQRSPLRKKVILLPLSKNHYFPCILSKKKRKKIFIFTEKFCQLPSKSTFPEENGRYPAVKKKKIPLVLHKQFKEKSWNYCLDVAAKMLLLINEKLLKLYFPSVLPEVRISSYTSFEAIWGVEWGSSDL